MTTGYWGCDKLALALLLGWCSLLRKVLWSRQEALGPGQPTGSADLADASFKEK